MMRRVTGDCGAGEPLGPGGPGWYVRQAAWVGLTGLVVYSVMLGVCLLAHLVLWGPVETFGPDGMWRPLVYTFGLVWPVGTGVVLLGRVDRRSRQAGRGGLTGVLPGWRR